MKFIGGILLGVAMVAALTSGDKSSSVKWWYVPFALGVILLILG